MPDPTVPLTADDLREARTDPLVEAGPRFTALVEHLCKTQHDAYEDAAVKAGWQTQERSRKPWDDVPEANRATMRASMLAVLDALASLAGTDREGLVALLAPPPGWFLDRDGHGTRALWLDHPDGPADPWPRMLAAEHAGQSALWDWLGTVIPTRTEGDTPDA